MSFKIVDYTKSDNPYKAKFVDQWGNVIDKSTTLSPFMSINKGVIKMIKRSNDVMSGTIHEKDWMFYHDALSLMTSKDYI